MFYTFQAKSACAHEIQNLQKRKPQTTLLPNSRSFLFNGNLSEVLVKFRFSTKCARAEYNSQWGIHTGLDPGRVLLLKSKLGVPQGSNAVGGVENEDKWHDRTGRTVGFLAQNLEIIGSHLSWLPSNHGRCSVIYAWYYLFQFNVFQWTGFLQGKNIQYIRYLSSTDHSLGPGFDSWVRELSPSKRCSQRRFTFTGF